MGASCTRDAMLFFGWIPTSPQPWSCSSVTRATCTAFLCRKQCKWEHPWENLCSVLPLKLIMEKSWNGFTTQEDSKGTVSPPLAPPRVAAWACGCSGPHFDSLHLPKVSPLLSASLSAGPEKSRAGKQEALIYCPFPPEQAHSVTLLYNFIPQITTLEWEEKHSENSAWNIPNQSSKFWWRGTMPQTDSSGEDTLIHTSWPHTLGAWCYSFLPFSQPSSPLKSSHTLNYGLDGWVQHGADV